MPAKNADKILRHFNQCGTKHSGSARRSFAGSRNGVAARSNDCLALVLASFSEDRDSTSRIIGATPTGKQRKRNLLLLLPRNQTRKLKPNRNQPLRNRRKRNDRSNNHQSNVP